MKFKQSLVGATLMLPFLATACPLLEGDWQSSKPLFEKFNQQWAKVEDKPWAFMQQTQGYETISYSLQQKRMTIVTPAIPFKLGKIDTTLPASEKEYGFDVLACTQNSVAIKYQLKDQIKIDQLHFVDKDTYWVYMGQADSDGNSHIREYYIRK